MLSSGLDRDVRTEGLRWPLEKSPPARLTVGKVAVLFLMRKEAVGNGYSRLGRKRSVRGMLK